MIDWVGGSEDRNYGVKRAFDARNLTDLLRIISPLAILAGLFLFHSWISNQMISFGYEGQQLRTMEEKLLREQKNLILEEETLKNPERIDLIARNELGMTPLRPNQLIPPQIQNTQFGSSTDLAMARTSITPAETR